MAERSLTCVNRFTTRRFTLAHNFQERTGGNPHGCRVARGASLRKQQVIGRDHEHARRTEAIGPRTPEFHLKTA